MAAEAGNAQAVQAIYFRTLDQLRELDRLGQRDDEVGRRARQYAQLLRTK